MVNTKKHNTKFHNKILVCIMDADKAQIFLKPLQNKKGQKNYGYPTKKQSFSREKDCFFVGYPNFFGRSYFEKALENISRLNSCVLQKLDVLFL